PVIVVHSDLLNLNQIRWEKLSKNGDTYIATSSNSFGSDSLLIEIPTIFDNVFTDYPCTVTMTANKFDDKKLRLFKDYRTTISVDSRSDSLVIYFCSVYARTQIAGQSVNVEFSTNLKYPK
ncbi:MAG: hypothetical protein ACI9JN_002439, partial [Bacteroidia bacterium]